MEGDTRIELHPTRPAQRHGSGNVRVAYDTPFVAWAVRRDRGGSVQLFADLRAGGWDTRFEIRTPIDPAKRPAPDWKITIGSETWHIEAVDDVAVSRRRKLWLYAVRNVR